MIRMIDQLNGTLETRSPLHMECSQVIRRGEVTRTPPSANFVVLGG